MPPDRMISVLSGSGFITHESGSNLINADKAFFASRVYRWIGDKIKNKLMEKRAFLQYADLLRLYKKDEVELVFKSGELYVRDKKNPIASYSGEEKSPEEDP